jgi:hypothetical protein
MMTARGWINGEERRMEQRYEFEGAEVKALVEESRAAKEREMTFGQRCIAAGVSLSDEDPDWEAVEEHPGTGAPPGLWLMNDRGIYLRSNATKRNPDSVAYARGYRADVKVGDDDLTEFLDAGQLDAVAPGDTLVVTLTDNKVRLSLLRPQ